MQGIFLKGLNRPLRELVEENGWSVTEVARRAEVGISTISNFLNGETRGGPDLIKKLSVVFNIPEEEIERKQPGRERVLELREESSTTKSFADRAGGAATREAIMARKRALSIATEEMSDQDLIAKITKTLHDQRLPKEERYETALMFMEVLSERTKLKRPGNGNPQA